MVKNSSTGDANDSRAADKGGRPEHNPTDEQRKTVEVLAQYGVKKKAIAHKIGVSPSTLERHYLKELLTGDVTVQTLIGQTSMRVALGSPAEYYPLDHQRPELRGKLMRAEVPPNDKLLMFFLKTRLGMIPHLGLDLNPGNPEDVEFNTAGLTNQERITRIADILDKVSARMKQKPPAPAKKPQGRGGETAH